MELDIPVIDLVLRSLDSLPNVEKQNVIHKRAVQMFKKARAKAEKQYLKSQERLTKAGEKRVDG